MKRHSTAPLLLMCLVSAGPYIDIDRPVQQPSGSRSVDVIVGNRGDPSDHESFDAVLEVRTKSGAVCSATTNFVTPIAPGQSIRALRFDLRPFDSQTAERFTLRASIHYWDKARASLEKKVLLMLPPGRGSCIALKPPQ